MKIVTIGRGPENDVVINDPAVSRHHCEIIQDEGGSFMLKDTQSTNGTYVNGVRRPGTTRLNKSDIVRVGNTTLPWQTYFPPEGQRGTDTGGGNGCYTPPPPPQTRPDNFLVWAILCTIFCCIPFGIVSIVMATKVNKLWDSGDYFGAERAANNARTWFWWAFALGLLDRIAGCIIIASGIASAFI